MYKYNTTQVYNEVWGELRRGLKIIQKNLEKSLRSLALGKQSKLLSEVARLSCHK